MLIDSHAHIDDEKFDADRQAVIKRALESGIEKIINPGADEASSRRAVLLAENHECIYAAVGIHPHDAKTYDDNRHDQMLKDWAKKEKVVAIGEIGLDYHYDLSPRDVQKAVFIKQIELAREVDLPIIIHNRESMADMEAILKAHFSATSRGVMHSYSGSVEMAKVFLDMGLYLSISGPLTFKNARKLPDVVKMLPLDRMLVETDSPYLTPTPHRGKRNEPAYVRLVAQEVARIKGMELEAIEEITAQNAIRLFNLK